ncbi:secreted protein [Bacillus atrophaeus UCMB-5137]|uniref:NAD(P)-binding domain-containing protein n=1 Tax=Bacillus atrophaeus TaxID=1452 RepID=UPI000330EC18|nr:NAD(P)-binding domain-containing protein [Bacillus atrophaeus]AKL86434.1 secreted protein [Bacillus atrophaeus UCMB-5137]
MKNSLPVAIIGGGPVGAAAAARLVQKQVPFILFEAGEGIGTHFLDYRHVRLFSPWAYNIDQAAKELLMKHNVPLPPEEELPHGEEIVSLYLKPLTQLPELKPHIYVNTRVVHVGRKGFDKVKTAEREKAPFVLRVKHNDTEEKIYEAKAVIDATGTWQNPNPISSGGIFSAQEKKVAKHIYYGIPDVLNRDRDRFQNKTIAVVGSGHSAINTLLDLAQLKQNTDYTKMIWILRKQMNETFGGGDNDQLPARGELGLRLRRAIENGLIKVYDSMFIHSVRPDENGTLQITGERQNQPQTIEHIDEIIANTGSRPDFTFLREVRHTFDPALECVPDLAELIDPNIHSCGTVRPHGEKELRQPEKDFYIIGSKSYGRAPTFLLATGYEQARSVVEYITGDKDAAKRVELKLPETGVCKLTSAPNTENSCCS